MNHMNEVKFIMCEAGEKNQIKKKQFLEVEYRPFKQGGKHNSLCILRNLILLYNQVSVRNAAVFH